MPVHQAVELTYYRDKDEDGFGNINDFLVDTVKPGVMLLTALIATTKTILSIPVQKEIVDGIDNDCDGSIDEDQQYTFYRDADEDGYGDFNDSFTGL